MKFVIMTNPNGFQMRDGVIAEYATAEDAMKKAGPGDQIIPISEDIDVVDFQTGKERLPIYNRSGIRDLDL